MPPFPSDRVLRLSASHAAACKYLAQFPSHTVASAARFVAFVAGSFAALLLLVTMLDETLLERPLAGRHIVWWLAVLGVVLTASRALVRRKGGGGSRANGGGAREGEAKGERVEEAGGRGRQGGVQG